MWWIWPIFIILAMLIAAYKKMNIWIFMVLGIFTGPLGVILAK